MKNLLSFLGLLVIAISSPCAQEQVVKVETILPFEDFSNSTKAIEEGVIDKTCTTFLEAKDRLGIVSDNQIENGDYQATVYYNSSTGKKSTYRLVVTVIDDAVVVIHFGNNGSVHAGRNNEGYSYTGGDLSFSKDYKGHIVGASTVVQVKDLNGTIQQFQIEIG